MARIYPFHAYRYARAAGNLSNLVTQPYDKISPTMQAQYLQASPYNLVRVILGERYEDDSESNNVYTRAAKYLEKWLEQAVLQRDAEPGLYPYFQEFTIPDTGETLVRKGFIGLGEVTPYSAGVVHRHEQTLAGPKKDRMQVLFATGAHFGQIFMLYPDPEEKVDTLLEEEMAKGEEISVTDEYGAVHRMGRITNANRIAQIQQLMAEKKLLIADGHHRYETALAYRDANPGMPGARAVMMTFVNMHSAGLRILGTHRVLRNFPGYSTQALLKKSAGVFQNVEVGSLEEMRTLWAREPDQWIRIGLAAADTQSLWMLERRRADGELDVTALHNRVLEGMLGITAEAVRQESYLKYVRGADKAVEEVREQGAQAAFLLEPPTIEQVAAVSFAGGVMPQKSTDFYPKLLSGMTIYRLADGLPKGLQEGV